MNHQPNNSYAKGKRPKEEIPAYQSRMGGFRAPTSATGGQSSGDAKKAATRQRAPSSAGQWKSTFQPTDEAAPQDYASQDISTSNPQRVELYDPYNQISSESESEMGKAAERHHRCPQNDLRRLLEMGHFQPGGTHSGGGERHDRSGERRDQSAERCGQSGEWRDRSPERRDRSGEWQDRSAERQDRSREWRDRSPERRDRIGEWEERIGEWEDRSPERRDRSPEPQNRSPERRDRSPERQTRSPERRDRSSKWEDRSPERQDRRPERQDRRPERWDRSAERHLSPSGSHQHPQHLHRASSPDVHRNYDQLWPARPTERSSHERHSLGQERAPGPPMNTEFSTSVVLSTANLPADHQLQTGYSETGGSPTVKTNTRPPREVRGSSGGLMSVEMEHRRMFSCELCEVKYARLEALHEHLESRSHWDIMEHIQLLNNYDDLTIAFLQEVVMFNVRQGCHAMVEQNIDALKETDYLTRVDMLHCAACNVYISTYATSVESHLGSVKHHHNKQTFCYRQKRQCLEKAAIMMDLLKPQFQQYREGGNPFK